MLNKCEQTPRGISLLTTTLLTTFMAFWSYFFVVGQTRGLDQAAAWIVFVGLMVTYFRLLRSDQPAKIRRILFVLMALLFFPEFIAGVMEARGHMDISAQEVINNELPTCHISIMASILPALTTGHVTFPGSLDAAYRLLLIWLAATLTIGRGWCSWVCFYGGWDEGAASLSRKRRLKLNSENDRTRYFGFVILVFVVLTSLSFMLPTYCEWLCPFRLVTEFERVDSFVSYLSMIMLVVIFFGLVVVLPFLTKKRTQCMSFCPFGAAQSLLDRFSLYRVRIDTTKCIGCMKCVRKCPTMSLFKAIIAGKTGKPLVTCTKCGECMDVCPSQAIAYSFAFCKGCPSKLPTKEPVPLRGNFARLLSHLTKSIREIFSPKALFCSTAFFFLMVFYSVFAVGTIGRLLNLVFNGTFQ